ncbi:hypothetical protein B0H15DRAFT_781592 [Mycena belliarum]|uniref:Uncharacterized protein n=1 Tax=Mycena belliarum TaxID=1033014 RepID=A0AAD6U4S5_9AGAR|nr:hypothetical protein B0H15DRAFT_781592 [Mycena belliae]
MYSGWPATNEPRNSHFDRKGNAKGKEKSAPYPVLDHGTLVAAALHDANGRLEWTSIVADPPKAEQSLLKSGKPVLVFPATRTPPLQLSKMSVLHRAEQGANFLRTFVPDIDIPAELIRDEITKDAKILREFEDFDPYAGNQLEPIIRWDSSSKQSSFLAFPVGELKRDLNVSPFVYSKEGGACLKPSPQSIRTFDTPIQQISASKCIGQKQGSHTFWNEKITSHNLLASYLLVRTFGTTSLLEFKTSGSASNPAMHVEELGSITSSATGGMQAVDVKIAATPLDMTLVNNQGAVRLVRRAASSLESDIFWRLELTDNMDTCLLMSKNRLKKLDFRTKDTTLEMYAAISNEILTSVEDFQTDSMIRLCTTNQVIWIDRRSTAKPLLSFNHGRAFDRTLEVKTIAFQPGHPTILSSRKNSLLSIYDISRSNESLVHVQTPPYCLTALADGVQKGHTFLRHPLDPPDSPVSFFRLSDVGSIRAFLLSTTDRGEVSFSWSEDVKRLTAQSARLQDEASTHSSRDLTMLDMFPAYDHIFRVHSHEKGMDAEEAAESLYDLIEKAPSYWQDFNGPVDQVLTTYDVLFRSGDEPPHPTRADFLTDSVVNSTRSYRALLQGRVSTDSYKKGAAWNYDLIPTLSRFDADMAPDLRTVADHLRRFDLHSDAGRSAQSVRREVEAREQLVLDLAMSHHVYSPQPFSVGGDVQNELETMTKTLSLDDEPPPVSFTFLRPIAKNSDDKEDSISMGVRSLLKDWDVGTDPRKSVYRDLYGGGDVERAPIRRRAIPPTALPSERSAAQQRPPTVVAATSTSQFHAGQRFLTQEIKFHHRSGSQPVTMDTGISGMSQDFMASTQILPGAYGGRPAIKKKVVKKRVGGF